MSEHSLTCQQLVELVTDYLEDALAPDEKARFDRHLHECEGCSRYLEQMRLTLALTGQLTERDVPVPAKDALLQIFHDWKRSG